MSASPVNDLSIANLRKEYKRARLLESDLVASPQELFERWLNEAIAAKLPEPNAMTLATVDVQLRPSTRIVLLKGTNAEGLVWFTNYESRKGRDLDGNPWAALQFHWVELERVVRIEGRVSKTSAEESDAYFASRPVDSRVGAWASQQSRPINSRGVLVARAAKYAAKYMGDPPRPPHWGGYRLVPDCFEFWQGRASRLHDRIQYRLEGVDWKISRLAP